MKPPGHLRRDPRMTLMWCSFTRRPLILRAYGNARTLHPRDADWPGLLALFDPLPRARQIYEMNVDLVQTSCGFAVPTAEGFAPRHTLRDWSTGRGDAGLAAYWAEHNTRTLDGDPTGILE